MKSKQQGLSSNAVKMRWPTPRVSDIEGAPATNAEYNNGSWSRLNSKGVRFGIKLKDAVNYFPTPKAQNANSPGEHGRGGKDLQTIISKFPTPASRDYKGSSSKILEKGRNPLTNSLCDAIEHKTVEHLNPDWVEFYLMGWPRNWTSLEPLISEEMKEYAKSKIITGQTMRGVSKNVQSENIQWSSGRPICLRKEKILQSKLFKYQPDVKKSEQGCATQEGKQDERHIMPSLQDNRESRNASCGWQYCEQCGGQQDDVVRCLSREMALESWENHTEETVGLYNLWDASQRAGLLSKTLPTLQEIWKSLDDKEKDWLILCAYSGANWAIDPSVLGIITRTTNDTKYRINRLKAIGNGQVPICMATAFLLLTKNIIGNKQEGANG